MPDKYDFSQLTNEQLTDLHIEFERQRYALQMEIGRRGIGLNVDLAASRYFHVGKLVYRDKDVFEVNPPKLNESDLDDLMTELDL